MPPENTAFFFDFDGTLVPLAPTPDSVQVEAELANRLRKLNKKYPNRIAIVSGRDVSTIDALLGPVAAELAVAGSHGAELRQAGQPCRAPVAPDGLTLAADTLASVAAEHGLYFERKPFGVGLHYRMAPDREEVALAAAAEMADRHGLVLQQGKMMAEVRAPGTKGQAVAELLALPEMAGTHPLFFGDDVTDEDGFRAAAAAGGAGVLVGGPRATAAAFRLDDPQVVNDWIEAVLAGEDA